QTLLQEHKTTGFTECHARKPFQTFIQISLEDIQKMQERLGYENFNILFVLNYVQDYLTKWNSISSSPNYSAAFYDMLYFNYSLEARITQYFELLTEFVELQKKDADSAELFRLKSATTTLEGYIIRLIEIANIGFGQRFVGLEASSSIGVSLLSGMFGGLNRVANAAALIPEYLYQSAQDKDCAYPWLGYIFFKQIYGYEIISEGEVISMPESAILYPLFAGTSWLTLTHEVAHGFFFRLGLHKNDTLEGLKNKISELLLARIKSQKGES